MAEPLPQKSGRCLHVLESSGLIEYGPTLEITLGRCLRLLPGRREVYFADTGPFGAGQFVAKRYLPHAKQERDARREWQGLRFLHENELPGPQPYFLAGDAADGSGSLWVLMEKIEALEALDQIIARQILGSIDRRAMVRQMVDVVCHFAEDARLWCPASGPTCRQLGLGRRETLPFGRWHHMHCPAWFGGRRAPEGFCTSLCDIAPVDGAGFSRKVARKLSIQLAAR